jgi:hypothetical protein
MNKKQKTLLLVGVPVLIGAYLIYKQFSKSKSKGSSYVPPATPKPEVNPVRTTIQNQTGCTYPLKKGLYNCDLVKQVQWALNRIPIDDEWSERTYPMQRPLKEDGDFGSKTASVLWAWGHWKAISDQNSMNTILHNVVEDPAQFQAIENPYIVVPEVNPNYTFDPFKYPM